MNGSAYLASVYALPFEETDEIRDSVLSEIKNGEEAVEYYNDLLEKSIRYTECRSS